MCLFAAIGLLAPRVVLVLIWLFNASFVLSPFSGLGVPNPVGPVLGLIVLPTTTLGYCWAVASFEGVSTLVACLLLLLAW